jgi:hypothetical protein
MRTVEDLFKEAPDKTLYHYTGIGALLGIVENRKLWASHIYYLNDAAEIVHARDVLVKLIEKEKTSTTEKDFLDLFQEWLKTFSKNAYHLFVFSLSEEPNLLSQWRSYTPHGKGVSIGFSSDLLLRVVKAQELRIARCLYDRHEQEELMLGLLQKMLISFRQLGLTQNTSKSKFFQKYHGFLERFRGDILQLFSVIKHPSFKEEREWRIIYKYYLKYTIPQIKFREGASMLVPYFEIDIDPNKDEKLLFDRVYLGPSQHNELSHSALSNFLSNKAVCNQTKSSGITYREW